MLLAAAALLPGCTHSPGTQPPPDGVLTLNIDPAPVAVSNLVLQSARMQIDKLTVIGDTVPDGRSMLAEIVVDLLAAARSFSFGMLPQGVYSRVTFRIDSIQMQGTWRGLPLQIQIDTGDTAGLVDLRSSSGVELSAGHDATLAVSVDTASWFAGDLLDSATQSSSQIVVDLNNNTAVGAELLARAVASFALHDSPIP